MFTPVLCRFGTQATTSTPIRTVRHAPQSFYKTINLHRKRTFDKAAAVAANNELERLKLQYTDKMVEERVAKKKHVVRPSQNAYRWYDLPSHYSSHADPLREGAEWSFADENRTQPLATTKYQLNRKLIQQRLAKEIVEGLETVRKYEEHQARLNDERKQQQEEYDKNKPIAKGDKSADRILGLV